MRRTLFATYDYGPGLLPWSVPLRYDSQAGWSFPGLKNRWAIYAEIHNLKRVDAGKTPRSAYRAERSLRSRADLCYWDWAGMKYAWGTFNYESDPLEISQARTYVGAWLGVLKSVHRVTRGD